MLDTSSNEAPGQSWVVVYTPEEWIQFQEHGASVVGFPKNSQDIQKNARPGDHILCYITKEKKFAALLEVTSSSFIDLYTPIWKRRYRIRLRVNELCSVCDIEDAISFHDLQREAPFEDFTKAPTKQQSGSRVMTSTRDRVFAKFVTENTPDDETPIVDIALALDKHRLHLRSQLELALLGTRTQNSVLPAKDDLSAVQNALREFHNTPVLSTLPADLQPLERIPSFRSIDLIYCRKNELSAAFEIECTTSIFSGLLRFEDVAKSFATEKTAFYIVAPEARRTAVMKSAHRASFRDFRNASRLRFMSIEDLEKNFQEIYPVLQNQPSLSMDLRAFEDFSTSL